MQISNMAVVNQITFDSKRRYNLISYRNGFTSVANFTMLLSALYLFSKYPSDRILQFRALSIIMIALGSITTLFYLLYIRETKLERDAIYYSSVAKEMKVLPN